MAKFARYSVYVIPDGPLYDLGAAWLGWDSVASQPQPHPDLPGISDVIGPSTQRPRRYGFHGTLKPPFVLADGMKLKALERAVTNLCTTRAPVTIPAMEIRQVGTFLAIVPSQPCAALSDLAADVVQSLDPFRAAPADAELAKRRRARLTARQEEMLLRWGYPYVLDEFRFHMTLTGRTERTGDLLTALTRYFAQPLSQPLTINALCLMGEDADGFFHCVTRCALAG